MKILHTVESYSPSVGGMQEVVKQISERLVRLGHDVTVATKYNEERKSKSINGVKIESFKISGNLAAGIVGEQNEIERYKKFIKDFDGDVVTNFAAQQWATDLVLPILDEVRAKKVFVPTGFSGLYWPKFKNYFEELKDWMKKYDMNVFLSNDYKDVNFAKDNGVTKRVLIPNGAGEDEFDKKYEFSIRKRFGIKNEQFLIITVGSHTGAKGHIEAIRMFLKANIKDAVLLIIGNSFGGGCEKLCKTIGWLNKGIIVPNLTREETVVAYKEADLFLFPSNIECSPIVLFECMASKLPFISTDVGNAKEIVEWSKAGQIINTKISKNGWSSADIGDGARKILELYEKKETRMLLSKNGHTVWKEKFSWEKIALSYEKMYKNLIGNV